MHLVLRTTATPCCWECH